MFTNCFELVLLFMNSLVIIIQQYWKCLINICERSDGQRSLPGQSRFDKMNFVFLALLFLLYGIVVGDNSCEELLSKDNDVSCMSSSRSAVPECWLNGTMGGYFSPSDVDQRFKRLHCLYPSLLSEPIDIGKSVQNRTINAYRLGHGAASGVNLLTLTMVQAHDVTSLVTLIYAIEQLCREYNAHTDTDLVSVLDTVSLIIVPIVNVDAFALDTLAHPHGGGESVRNVGSYHDPRVQDVKCGPVNLDRNL
jgi:hypothetical protein